MGKERSSPKLLAPVPRSLPRLPLAGAASMIFALVSFPQFAIASAEIFSENGADSSFNYADVSFSLYPDGPSVHNCSGVYGNKSTAAEEKAALVHVKSARNGTVNTGCHRPDNAPSSRRWIALVQRGECKFDVKVFTAARSNASALVVYNHDADDKIVMAHEDHGIVTVIIDKDCGDIVAYLADLLEENSTLLYVTISPSDKKSYPDGAHLDGGENSLTRTSVLIVSITFIVLMIFSLAWLVFYYVQRFRFANMKDRITRQLAEAAKRAIKRIPKRSVCQSDMAENNVCAVCIESYKDCDVVRELPCSHVFHKQCIDHWLIEKRVCPMCKLNILEALGVRVKGAIGASDAGSAGSRDGESGTWDVPMTAFLVSPSQAPRSIGGLLREQQHRGDVEVDAGQCDESMSLVGDSPVHHGGSLGASTVVVAAAHLSSPNRHQ